ncbi:MAG: MFS transporter [Thermoleophilaceae bacterium]|nr:MFS transporter [Thermoleophilaceae bacterium]
MSTPAGRWVLTVAVLGSGVAFLEATVVNVALPAIGRDLNAEVSGLQWVLNGYLLSLAGLILLGGSLGDRYGRRRVFIVGMVWFSIASTICAFAPTIELLIAARIFQGIGGALLTPGSLAIIESVFARADRARAIGAWSGLVGVSGAIGPLLGGYLVDAVSWRAVFLITLPLGLVVSLAASRYVPETRDPTVEGRLDVLGSVLATVALAGGTLAIVQVGESLTQAAIAGLIGLLAGVAFVLAELRAEQPMLPLEIFASRQFSGANVLTFIVYAALGGVFFLLVAFLQVSLGYSAIAAGAAALPTTVAMLLLSSRAGALAQRIGPRLPLTFGPLLIAAGMGLMALISPGDTYVGSILPAVTVFGLGLALTVAPITATVLAAAEERHSGIASGVNNAVARTAQLAAIAALPVLVGLGGSDFENSQAMAEGFQAAMWIAAALCGAGAVVGWLTISNDVLERDEPQPGSTDYHCPVTGPPLRHGPAEARSGH